MTPSADLGRADLGALLDLIGDARDDDPGPVVPWAMLTGLNALIPSYEVAVNQFDLHHRRMDLVQYINEGETLTGRPSLAATSIWWTYFPRSVRENWGDRPPDVVRWSARELVPSIERSALYEEFWAPSTDCLSIMLPAQPGHERRLVFWRRDGETFTDRDEALLTLLRPHLIEIDQDARRRRAGTPQLTPREWQILELVANGLSNADVAQALVTSVSTVRKHLEHIYDHTGTRSRSAAVAKMLPR